jgi:uncharacterized iron-regulated protein
MKRFTHLIAAGLCVLSMSACASLNAKPSEPELGSDLRRALETADVVIIGEKHDNPHHHRLQADIIRHVGARGVAFEMVPQKKEEAVNRALKNGEGTDRLREILEWETSGWPDWDMYAPLFVASPGAYIAGGEINRDAARMAMEEGPSSQLENAARYGLDQPLPEEQQADLIQELIDTHCGMIPESLAISMAKAQRLRDASFAEASLRAIEKRGKPVVLITGSGHARIDRGVPLYLRRAAPDFNVVSIGLTEPGDSAGDVYDFTLETEAVEREDPCAAFAEQMSN